MTEAAGTLTSDLGAYRDALAQASGFTGGGDPDDGAIAELRTRARNTATAWTARSDRAKRTMKTLVADAEAVVEAADKKYCR